MYSYMGTRRGNFKSKLIHLVEYFLPRKPVPKFSEDVEEIDYEAVFKHHASLMNSYRAVLKRDAWEFNWFFRTWFIESHIYKKLRSLRKIYLVELAALDNGDNPSIRSRLNSLVEDTDKFSGSLFHFSPAKTVLSIITIMVSIIGPILKLLLLLLPEPPDILMVLRGFLDLLDFILYPILVLIMLSFIDKRRLFIFYEDAALGFFDRLKMRLKAFLERDREGAIYEKENLLFHSLRMRKKAELPIDLLFTPIIILIIVTVIDSLLFLFLAAIFITISLITSSQHPYFFLLILLMTLIPSFLAWFLALRRKAK
jgi:hypothetical protein